MHPDDGGIDHLYSRVMTGSKRIHALARTPLILLWLLGRTRHGG